MTDAWTAGPSLPMRAVTFALPVLRYKPIMRREERARRDIARSAGGRPARPSTANRREFRLRNERFGALDCLVIEPRPGPASDRSLIWLHGGAFVHQFERAHWWLATSLVRELGVRVVAPDYLLAPRGTASRALEQVTEALKAVAATDGAAPVLGGDSAGGGLAASLALTASGALRPSHLVLVAPWLDVTLSHPEVPLLEPRDPSLAVVGLRLAGRLWAGELDPRDPRVSPAFAADYSALPATSLIAGTRDLLYPDARDFAASARAQGVDIGTFTASDGFHVFPAASRLPESRAARRWLAERLAATGSCSARST